jgi:hypothetical protein
VNEYRSVLERAGSNFPPLDLEHESIVRGRDRKRRNQRIAAGVVGIAVFVAAIWIVTSGGAFGEATPAVPGSQTGPPQTAPPPARAQAAPDVVETGECSAGARSRLELTGADRRIKVRFEVRRSPVGHFWHIVLRHSYTSENGDHHDPPRHARILASESGDFVVQVRVKDNFGPFEDDFIRAKAADTQTGQVCTAAAAWYR